MGKRYRVMLFMLLVVGEIYSFGQTVQAEDAIEWPIAIDESNFPDEEFRNYLLEQDFGIDDGKLSKEEMENVTGINVGGNEKITSLEGIEYLQNLEVLYCYKIGISELDISNNTNLKELSCYNTGISILDVSNCKNLEILYCSNTGISILDVSNNPKLESLDCSNTEISILDVSQNPNLKFLSCSNTGISELDISQNPNLVQLWCYDTGISELDVSQNPNLKELLCDDTGISELDVSQNLNLVQLWCSYTGISRLNVSQNPNLKELLCGDTGINRLDVSQNPNLVTLSCYDTGISELDVSQNPNLVTLSCYGTGISSLDISKNTNLIKLSCGSTGISSLDVSNTSLTELFCYSCVTPVLISNGNTIDLSQLSGLDASKISNLKNATLSDNKLIVEDSSEKVSYTYDCGRNISETFNLEISLYEIEYNANGGTDQMARAEVAKREFFTLPENEFTAPSGMQFKEWSIGSIDGEKVKEGETYTFNEATIVYAIWKPIPVSAATFAVTYHANGGTGQMAGATATEVKAFTLPQNSFTAPSGKRFKEWAVGSPGGVKVKAGKTYTFSEATTVYAVWERIPDNTIEWPVVINETNFPDEGFRNYLLTQDFGIDDGKLSKEEMENVTRINVSGNENIISLEGIKYFQNLEVLDCYEMGISELDITQNTKLEILHCYATRISSLDVSKNDNLEQLYCANTRIKSLDVSNNTNLKSLNCGETEISSLDISNNINLQVLSCGGTEISSLDISNNTKLVDLLCSNTRISNLDVSNHTRLVQLLCSNTRISNLDVSNSTRLEHLSCVNTKINILNVSNNTKLKQLVCRYTGISNLDVSNNTKLIELDCGSTGLSNLDVSNNIYLKYLDCSTTKISSLDVSNNTNLIELSCGETGISSLDVSNTSLTDLSCPNCITPVLLSNGNTIDLSLLSGLEASKISNLKNATLADNKLTVKDPLEKVSYTYDCGKGMSVDFNLEISSYEINYDANDGTGQMETGTATKGELFTLPENGFIASSGMQFKEWAIGSKEGDKVKAGKTYIFSEATTVYAVWEKIPETYTITYDPNGGAGQMAKATATKEKAFTLPQNSFTAPSGMQFKEWAIGSTSGAKVKAGSTYIFTGATTIYAVWEPIPVTVTTYAITYHANGGTGQMAQATATKEKAFTLPQNSFTAPSGMQFKEWAVGSTGGAKVKAGGTYTFTGATTVYAIWEKIPETVKEEEKASFEDLQLKAKASKTSNKLSWKRVKGADGYVVYGAKRGKKLSEIKASTKGVSFTHKKLSKKTFYQYQVKAYRLVNGEKKFISVSQVIYSVTTGGKYDNPKKLTVNVSKLTLKKGKTKTIKAKLVGTNGKKLKNYTKAFRYETSNSKIATVSAKGKIKARKKGKCIVYVYTQNGLSKSIRVTVK